MLYAFNYEALHVRSMHNDSGIWETIAKCVNHSILSEIPETFAESGYFEDVCFDGSYINLQDNAALFIENCSFNRLKKESVVPYSVHKLPKSKTVRIGNCIYTADKKVLLDYVGPKKEKDKIILFENTEKIDDAFKIHCKNPDAIIVNESKFFKLSEKVLHKWYGNKQYPTTKYGNEPYSIEYFNLEFCQRDIEHLDLDENIWIIKSYACAYCKNITSLDMRNVEYIQPFAFEGNSIKELTINDDYFLDIPDIHFLKLKKVTVYTIARSERVAFDYSINLYAFKESSDLKEIRIEWQDDGLKSTTISGGTIRGYSAVESVSPLNDDKGYRDINFCCRNMSNITDAEKELNIPKDAVIYVPYDPSEDSVFGLKVMKDYEVEENVN